MFYFRKVGRSEVLVFWVLRGEYFVRVVTVLKEFILFILFLFVGFSIILDIVCFFSLLVLYNVY